MRMARWLNEVISEVQSMRPEQSELSTMVITVIKAHECWLHGGETKPWTRKQEKWAPSLLSNAASLCAFGEITPLLGTPLSSFEKGRRNPCYVPIRLSCDAKAMSVKKLCIGVMI